MTFDEEFFTFLESKLTEYFRRTPEPELAGFWCDGVIPTKEFPNINEKSKNSKFQFKAFIGKSSQEQYQLILKLGNKSSKSIEQNQDLKKYFPDLENGNAFIIDLYNKVLEVEFQ